MNEVLYEMMDWAAVEEIVYSESAYPQNILGPHVTEEGILVQVFIPSAVKIEVVLEPTKKTFVMDRQDDEGFYSVLIPRKRIPKYTLLVEYDNGTQETIYDPYRYGSCYTQEDIDKFETGIHYEIYKKMGAHPMTIDGIEGVHFSVWAPCAMRVSVVGDFNLWDGRRHQMCKNGESGIYELFIPGISKGEIYKYEVKTAKGEPMLKSDPYGNFAQLRPDTASIVWGDRTYEWTDTKWMKDRKQASGKANPLSIYEVHLGSWMRKEIAIGVDGKEICGEEYYNYRELAEKLAEYVLEMGYTHVELMPIMEHPFDASWGYQVIGYYAPTSRYGTPEDFCYFVNYLHSKKIGVILDWVPAHFPRDLHGLSCFDGTCVYEHEDSRKGSHPHWGTKIYNYGRPQVSNYLIANALYWAKEFHVDGIRMDAVASMLYLDYGKNDGEWVANEYGGHENLEAIEFFKHLNSIMKKECNDVLLIAEESTAWPMVTGNVEEGSLGFDYKWNMGWMNDFIGYMSYDPFFRSYHYSELTFSLLYAYSEKFVLVFSHDEVVHGKGSMMTKMAAKDWEDKAQNLRTAYGFMYGHPGKKLLFMGQEFAQISEWSETEELPWGILEYPIHQNMKQYCKDLNQLYRSQPALYELDGDEKGFEWINCSSSADNIVSFIRKSKKKDETLLFVYNFAPIAHEKYQVGVPFEGKYKEIFTSDAKEYGGTGMKNPRAKASKKVQCDNRKHAIDIKLPPMSMIVFSCTQENQKKSGSKRKKKEQVENTLVK